MGWDYTSDRDLILAECSCCLGDYSHTGRVQLLYSETTLILAECSCCTRRLLSYWPSAAAVLGDYSHTGRVQLLYSETTLILAECSCCTRRLLSYWPSAAAVLGDYSHTGRVQLLYSETTLVAFNVCSSKPRLVGGELPMLTDDARVQTTNVDELFRDSMVLG